MIALPTGPIPLPPPVPGALVVVGGVAALRAIGSGPRARRRVGALRVGADRSGSPDRAERRLGWRGSPRGPSTWQWRPRLRELARRFRWVAAGSEAEHADLLEAVARSLRAGASLLTALEQAAASRSGRVATDLQRTLVAVHRGAPLGAALEGWAAGADPVRTMAGVALALGADLGGARARALDDAAASLRDRAALAGEIRALTAQARASAAVMVVAPIAFAVFGWLAEGGTASGFATPVGGACLVAGLTLDAVGAWWMAAWTRRVA